MNTFATIITILYFISEALSFIPSIKANGTFQLVFNIIEKLRSK